MRLRQVVLVARDLDPVVADLRAVLGLGEEFRDPDVALFELRNAVLPIGDTFLEVVCPTAPTAAAARYLEREGGEGGYMLMVQSDNADADRRRAAEHGVRVVWSADLPDIRGTHLHPRDLGGAILSLDQATPPQSWRWAGEGWPQRSRTDVTSAITAAEIESPDPVALAQRWAAIFGRTARVDGGAAHIELDRGAIRFVPSATGAERLSAFDVQGTRPQQVLETAARRGLSCEARRLRACGVWINLA
jgi:Glyoxalase-like domain